MYIFGEETYEVGFLGSLGRPSSNPAQNNKELYIIFMVNKLQKKNF